MFFFIGITMAVIQGGYARRIKPGNEIRVVKRVNIYVNIFFFSPHKSDASILSLRSSERWLEAIAVLV